MTRPKFRTRIFSATAFKACNTCSIQMIAMPRWWTALDRGDQLPALAFGQPAGDLVEQQKLGLGGKRPGEFQPLALEQGEAAGRRFGLGDQARLDQDLGAELGDVRLAAFAAEGAGDEQFS